MDLSAPSIFELSPSEKLQLVEDLWDDIASTSGGVPVHDWQIQEWDRRKKNLVTNPGSELSWDEVRRREEFLSAVDASISYIRRNLPGPALSLCCLL